MNIIIRFCFNTFLLALMACGGSKTNTPNNTAPPELNLTSQLAFSVNSQADNEPALLAKSQERERIRVPLYFWVVTSNVRSDISYKVSNPEIQQYIDGVNLIWDAADIEFFIERVQRIELDSELSDKYAAFLNGTLSSASAPISVIADTGQYNPIFGQVNVVLLKEFGSAAGATFYNESAIYLAESDWRGQVRRPGIFAHELGHALGLRNVKRSDSECNLMDDGSCGKYTEIYTSRRVLIQSLQPCQQEIARESALVGFALDASAQSVTCLNFGGA